MRLDRATQLASVLHILPTVSSTNDDMRERFTHDGALSDFFVVATDNQTHGKGRRGRTWFTQPRGSLAFSVLVTTRRHGGTIPPESFGWIPLLAGLAVARSVSAAAPSLPPQLKWPNDVLLGGKKVCGVLCETLASRDAVIVGVGINLALHQSDLPTPYSTSLNLEGAAVSADDVLSEFLVEFRSSLNRLAAANGDATTSGAHDAVCTVLATLESQVRIDLPDDSVLTGKATGLDDAGQLLVVTGDGVTHTISAGDVHHATLLS